MKKLMNTKIPNEGTRRDTIYRNLVTLEPWLKTEQQARHVSRPSTHMLQPVVYLTNRVICQVSF